MGLFNIFTNWLKNRALHFHGNELKGTPGVKDPVAAAAHANAVIGSAIDAAAPLGVAAVENALHLHPDTLKGAPGIDDHVAAADTVNAIIKAKVEGIN